MNKNESIELVESYAERVFFYCVKRCNNRMDAEDLSQTILLEILQNINKGAHIDNFDYYIWGVCKNQFNLYLRKTIKNRNSLDLVEEIKESDDTKSNLEQLIEEEKVVRMNKAIKLLSKDYTEILYAYYVEDKTLKFISEELRLPLGTVKWKLAKIREKLKEYLDMEQLNGKKAYIPKRFGGIASYEGEIDFNPHKETSALLIKNLLFHSYDNPCRLEDYSIELGISITYVEDYVTRLEQQQLLIKLDNGKYLTNIGFVDKITKRKIFDLTKKYAPILQESVVNFCKKNLDTYRALLNNPDIPDNLLMWSFLFLVKTNVEKDVERTKKVAKGAWDYCMAEITNDHEYDEYFISENGNRYPMYDVRIVAWPASVDNPNFKLGYRISYTKGASARENLELFDMILKKKEFKYSEITNENLKKDVDKYLELNYIRLEDDIVKVNSPIIKASNLEKLISIIKEDDELQKSIDEYNTLVYEEVKTFFPDYLNNQIHFIVGAFTNFDRALLINYAYDQGLLSLDEEHDHFVYNMILIKENE